ncbi:MAG: hypothetical protein NVS1B14_11500 [Vulcanimicrobiaceae bacterium]
MSSSERKRFVNLLVDLDDERFGAAQAANYERQIEGAGFALRRPAAAPEAALAWIDQEFGGTWSSEAHAGRNVIASRDGAYAGFVTYAPRGLRFRWLEKWRSRGDVGIFGPFGVAPAFRGSPLGQNLMLVAMAALRADGLRFALVPAVGGEALIAYYINHSGAKIVEEFDPAQWKRRKFRTAVLASGNGSNFQAVVDAAREERIPLDVGALVCNNERAFVRERAKASGVAERCIPWIRKAQTREEHDRAVLEAVRRSDPDLVLLLGWMHVLPERFFTAFPNVINIHPAFLPLDQTRDRVAFPDGSETPVFRGAHAIRDALAAGVQWVGASAHRVTFETDRGPVLVRKPMQRSGEADQAAVMQRLRPIEHAVLAGGIMRWVYEMPL